MNAVIKAATEVLAEALVVGFYLIFLLLEVRRLPERVRGGFDGERAAQILAVVGNVNAAIASYLRVKVRASLVLAVPATLVLWVFGVRFALMWGVLTFIANFIPYLGAATAITFVGAVAVISFDSLGQALVPPALYLFLNTVEAYIVTPLILSRHFTLNPVAVLLGLLFWGWIWGIPGALLAVPLLVSFKILCDHLESLHAIGDLLGGKE